MYDIALVLALLAVVAALVSVANRLSLPYPILLVIGGLILGFIPNRVLPDCKKFAPGETFAYGQVARGPPSRPQR